MRRLVILALLASMVPFSAAAQDADAGKAAFARCSGCHDVGEGAKGRMGPALNNIFGHPAGTTSTDFRYSKAMVDAGAAGLVWTPESLPAFLKKPKEAVPGTKMNFAGLSSDEDIANVIAYLQTFSPDYEPSGAAPAAPAESTPAPAPAQ